MPTALPIRSLLVEAIPFFIAAAAAAACLVAAGPTAGLFFGGLAFATLLTPPLALTDPRPRKQLIAAADVAAGISGVWLLAVIDEPALTAGHWFACTLLLIAYVLALWGLAALLSRLRLAPVAAAVVVTALGVLWLAWPVWLSPALAGRDDLVGRLTPAHPILAADGALTGLGPAWTERHYMYNELSVLNQDVPYELPRSVWPGCALHALIGIASLSLGFAPELWAARRRDRTVPPDGPDALRPAPSEPG